MAENLVIESPDFAGINDKAGYETEDAIRLLWFALNEEIKLRRRTVRQATDTIEGKIKIDAPTSQQDNYDTDRATIVYFTGSTAFTITGLRNGAEGRLVFFHNLGTGTVSFPHQNSGSAAANRIVTNDALTKTMTTDFSLGLSYVSGRWRELGLQAIPVGNFVLANGTNPLTADWDAGGFEIRAQTLEADVATGTAPLTIASTTVVSNLNADLLDGNQASVFLLEDGSNPLTANWDAGSFEIRAQTLESDVAAGTAPLTIASNTAVTNLNADLLDGNHSTAFAAASHTHPTSDIVSGTLANARVAVGNVTQHEASINHDALQNFASNEHFTEASIDHGSISGLGDDDHGAVYGNIGTTETISSVWTFSVAPDITASAGATPNISSIFTESLVKAWASVANNGTATLTDDYNVASVTRNGEGNVTVTFGTAMPNTTYCAIVTHDTDGNKTASIAAKATGSVRVTTRLSTNSNASDADFCVLVIGE